MIFTRRFGALRARPTFPSVTTVELEAFEAQRKAELRAHEAAVAAKAQARSHRLFRRGHSPGKHHHAT